MLCWAIRQSLAKTAKFSRTSDKFVRQLTLWRPVRHPLPNRYSDYGRPEAGVDRLNPRPKADIDHLQTERLIRHYRGMTRADSPPPSDSDLTIKRYSPWRGSLIPNWVLFGAWIGITIWLAPKAIAQGALLLCGVFALIDALLFTCLVYWSTVRIAIDGRAIVRTWLWGRRVVVLEDIGQMSLFQAKDSLVLHIRYGQKQSMSLTSNAFDKQDVRRMHRDILVALGFRSEPMWPTNPGYFGRLDIAQMLRYKRFQEEASEGETTKNAGSVPER